MYPASSLSLLLACAVPLLATVDAAEDAHAKCRHWGDNGECTANADWMHRNCGATCDGIASKCLFWAEAGECESNPTFMRRGCAAECDEVRARGGGDLAGDEDDGLDDIDYGISIGYDGLPFDMEAVNERREAASEHSSCASNATATPGGAEETCAWSPGVLRLPEDYPAKLTLAPPEPGAAATTLADLHLAGLLPTVEFMKPAGFSRSKVGAAVAVKVVNFTGKRLRKMWDDGSAAGVFNGELSGGLGDRSTLMTYDGHAFSFVDPATGALYRKVTMRHDVHFLVFRPDDDDREVLDSEAYRGAMREERFMAEYYREYGQPWLARYGRPPPVVNMWPANHVGQTHTVETAHGHWTCDDADDRHDPARCHDPSPLAVNLTVVSHAGVEGPRVFVLEDLMSDAECDHVLRLGKRVIRESEVGNSGSGFKSQSRTSMTGWLPRSRSPILETMQKRFADVLGLRDVDLTPRGLAEELQVVKYQHGQKYDPHHDFSDSGGDGYGQRFLTLLLYVVVPPHGGHTSFPKAYGGRGIKVKPPRRGGAVLFYSMLPDGNGDDLSLHAGQAVLGGDEKWVCNLWVWDPNRHA